MSFGNWLAPPQKSTLWRSRNVVYEGCKTTNAENELKAKTCPLEGEVGPLERVKPPPKRVFCLPSMYLRARFHVIAPLVVKWKLEVGSLMWTI